ncbi:hypothetical protein QYE76_020362 [Lolium multiflorum]|uniref:Uncharacterized protein n=1 Tax=Lolium multiflorum TaxID=4521 RepID=A0AAD8R654_LOLMU|nr:hypothetical protein QYE76_020362 [Lolium multiflorum]
MENYSLLMGAAAVMKMAVEMAAVSMEEPSGALPRIINKVAWNIRNYRYVGDVSDPYEPVQYDAPENPYDTTIVDYEPEVESSDVDSDDESFHTKTRHVLRRLQSGQYDGPFARGIYKCPFCNRRLRDTDFNTLLNHVESIGRYGARVGRTVNVHAYMAKHKALGIHLRNLQASHTRYLEALNVPTALSVSVTRCSGGDGGVDGGDDDDDDDGDDVQLDDDGDGVDFPLREGISPDSCPPESSFSLVFSAPQRRL